jgi:hypothetical protein
LTPISSYQLCPRRQSTSSLKSHNPPCFPVTLWTLGSYNLSEIYGWDQLLHNRLCTITGSPLQRLDWLSNTSSIGLNRQKRWCTKKNKNYFDNEKMKLLFYYDSHLHRKGRFKEGKPDPFGGPLSIPCKWTLTPKIPWDQKLVDCCLGSFCEDKFIFSIFSFRRVNYIFHKLSVNTKHVQFRLRMSPS